MARNGPGEFDYVKEKLQNAPKRKSEFERNKEEREKRARKDQEDLAELYSSFAESFEGDPETASRVPVEVPGGNFGGPPTGPRGRGRGHGGPLRVLGRLSSPPRRGGSGGFAPAHQNQQRAIDGQGEHESTQAAKYKTAIAMSEALDENDDEDAIMALSKSSRSRDAQPPKTMPESLKPAMILSSMPEDITEEDIRALLPTELDVEKIEMLPQEDFSPDDIPSRSARVTFSMQTMTPTIDNAASALTRKYLGCAYYLRAERDFPSRLSALSANSAVSKERHPFGATRVRANTDATGYRNVAPQGYTKQLPPDHLEVIVKPPEDLAMLRLINSTIATIIVQPTYEDVVEHEMMLMNQPQVRMDPDWAFLWDSESQEGIYYRWRFITGYSQLQGGELRFDTKEPQELYEGTNIFWKPVHVAKFQYAQCMQDVMDDPAFEEAMDDLVESRVRRSEDEDGFIKRYLDPLQRAWLVQLLGQLPLRHKDLTRNDVASVSSFCADRVDDGAEEVVEVLMLNLDIPFNLMPWARPPKTRAEELKADDYWDLSFEALEDMDDIDFSNIEDAKHVALLIITDLLGNVSNGMEKGWTYRTLLENVLVDSGIFGKMGRLDRDYGLGLMKKTQWQKRVNDILQNWEERGYIGSSVKELKKQFANPPPTEEEQKAKEALDRRNKMRVAFGYPPQTEQEFREFKAQIDAETAANIRARQSEAGVEAEADEAQTETMAVEGEEDMMEVEGEEDMMAADGEDHDGQTDGLPMAESEGVMSDGEDVQ